MVRYPRRVSHRLATLEGRHGPPADGDHRTAADLVAVHPELDEPVRILAAWRDRGAPPGDHQAAAAGLTVWLAVRGGRFDTRPDN